MNKTAKLLLAYLLIFQQLVFAACPELEKIIAEGNMNSVNYEQSNQETKLKESTAYWRNGRTSQKEFRRAKKALYLHNALQVDRPYVTVEDLESLFKTVYENYQRIVDNNETISKHSDLLVKDELFNKDRRRSKREMRSKLLENAKARNKISKVLEEYAAAKAYLDTVAASDGPGKDNATTVLYKLQPKFLLAHTSGENSAELTLTDLYKETELTKEARIKRLKRERRSEFIGWLLSISPSQAAIDGIEKIISNVPNLDKPKIHQFLSELSSQRDRRIYSSDIARIAMMHGDRAKQLEILEQINAETEDGFLKTFARGIESRVAWKALKKEAEKRDDKSFFNHMEKADKERGGDMSLIRNNGRDRTIHLALNAAIGTFFTYLGSKIVGLFINNDDKKDKELDKLIDFLEKDERGKELVEKFREKSRNPK